MSKIYSGECLKWKKIHFRRYSEIGRSPLRELLNGENMECPNIFNFLVILFSFFWIFTWIQWIELG